jgi:translation initiation factor 2 beta subunit (eIF-2beta)/eIF-5
MFKKLLGKKKEDNSQEQKEHAELVEKISKMNLSEMRSYINNRLDMEVSEAGLGGVLDKLTQPNPQTQNYYLQEDDMDSKKKKAFELILLIAKSQMISFEIVEKIQKFIEHYHTMITTYDKKYKEIYTSRLSDAVELALANINKMSQLKVKMDILGEND